ncbi:ATP-binding protein [Thermaerobacillus caldiproteolyticus]|uniref:DNA helicase HerA-like ATPase n=1 Tax=Thermaerobacillus caldiproteolyticus TaxID=247480 RepID=A0A7V9Z991_9BACL|nr:DUF87 domain-containing protein [Anoxybacillus caldiproteolyticus]MBA2876286.1 DNA helicase HerA-like ATPase [Anoxybacillus caldiproteolyticus]
MSMELFNQMTSVDLFALKNSKDQYVGRPFYLNYEKAGILTCDAWKQKVKGLPQGAFLLAFYENELDVDEALLLRVLTPIKLPTDNDIVSAMVEYYKDDLDTSGPENKLDQFTRYEFSFSGLECRILGTFYKNEKGHTCFGADVENFYAPNNYKIYKPTPEILEAIINFKSNGFITKNETDVRFGKVRYSSSTRFQAKEDEVPVYVTAQDFLGKRTALFGMTRTGKSNTVKKIIEATVELSQKAPSTLENASENQPFTNNGLPQYPVGQIIFDVNGEYANPNLQDEGTAIFELFRNDVVRYSVLEKPDFKVLKVNFYKDIEAGFELIKAALAEESGDYIKNFMAVELLSPEKISSIVDRSTKVRAERVLAAYKCCLAAAGFKPPKNGRYIKFSGNEELNKLVKEDGSIDPSKGVSLKEATAWFEKIWEEYNNKNSFFAQYEKKKGHDWMDNDLKAMLIMLTRIREGGKQPSVSGYIKLRPLGELHTDSEDESYEISILKYLRQGKIVIIDLSQGLPSIQKLYSQRLCEKIFQDAMNNFIQNKPNNFIQFYFEEAHNLFPKKDDKDLSQIYNRIAKEGAKLHLGLIYATQEVSSISSNILKNTQNWFISHLNNHDEIKELRKYYDFEDFTDSLIRFSASNDKGFVRMKTYSNSFVIPVQIDRFLAERNNHNELF